MYSLQSLYIERPHSKENAVRELLEKTMKCTLEHQVSHYHLCEKLFKQYQKICPWCQENDNKWS